jgi:hypothetical protein
MINPLWVRYACKRGVGGSKEPSGPFPRCVIGRHAPPTNIAVPTSTRQTIARRPSCGRQASSKMGTSQSGARTNRGSGAAMSQSASVSRSGASVAKRSRWLGREPKTRIAANGTSANGKKKSGLINVRTDHPGSQAQEARTTSGLLCGARAQARIQSFALPTTSPRTRQSTGNAPNVRGKRG